MKLKTLSSRIIIFVVIIAFVGAFAEAGFTTSRIRKTMSNLNTSISEIAREVSRVAATSGENSGGVKDIVSKNEQTGNVTNEIGRYAEESKQNASDLEDVIGKFTM